MKQKTLDEALLRIEQLEREVRQLRAEMATRVIERHYYHYQQPLLQQPYMPFPLAPYCNT